MCDEFVYYLAFNSKIKQWEVVRSTLDIINILGSFDDYSQARIFLDAMKSLEQNKKDNKQPILDVSTYKGL